MEWFEDTCFDLMRDELRDLDFMSKSGNFVKAYVLGRIDYYIDENKNDEDNNSKEWWEDKCFNLMKDELSKLEFDNKSGNFVKAYSLDIIDYYIDEYKHTEEREIIERYK